MARIAMIVEASSAGVGTHVADLAHCLLQREHTLRLIYSPYRRDERFITALASLRTYGGFSELCLPIKHQPHPSDALATFRIAADLRSAGPFDVVHCHSTKAGLVGRLAAIGTGARVVYTPHALLTMDPDVGRTVRYLSLALERALFAATDELIAVSDQEQTHMREIGLPARHIRVIANGIDIKRYRRDPERRVSVRRELGLQASETCVGFIGRIVPQKNLDVLLRSFQAAAGRSGGLRLVVVGSGPLSEAMVGLSQSLGLEDQVIWCGDRNAADMLPGFDIFALPSRTESCPYVVIEAMAQGIPVVATAVGGLPMLVSDGFNGRLVPAANVDAFSSALLELCAESKLRVWMGLNSLARAEEFSLARMVDRVEEIYATEPSRVFGRATGGHPKSGWARGA
jgi:glycosyltransferase involved in cell wall biosynthesis